MSDASEPVYERYKEALRRGHVASLRGRLEAALVAYAEAASIAPERPLPHALIGGVEVRRGRTDEALRAFSIALRIAPRDETALAGRADALASIGRRADAASTLDQLAEVQDGAGRLADALDTARRALELAESRARRRGVEALAERVRQSAGDQAAEQALAKALRLLEGPAGTRAAPELRGDLEDGLLSEGAEPRAEPEPPPPPPPDPNALVVEAEAALDAADRDTARARWLEASRAYEAAGQRSAAIDACYRALALDPGDPDVHLALARIYAERGWRGPAAEKLVLLDRLAGLTGDEEAKAMARALAAEQLADEPRAGPLLA